MKRTRKIFKAILAVVFMGLMVSVSSSAFAQGGCISGSVKDVSDNRYIQGVIITIKDVNTNAVAGTGNTDVLGNYSVNIPYLGNYTIMASKPGYENMTKSGVIELSDMTPNRTVNISMQVKALLKENPMQTSVDLSWDTGNCYFVKLAANWYKLVMNNYFSVLL